MISVEDIPDEVLEQVLHYLLWNEDTLIDSFKQGLFHLTICPRWRRLGKPVVFRQAFIDYGEMKNLGMSYWLAARLRHDEEAETKVDHSILDTNLNLIQAAGCSSAIKRININIDWHSSHFSCLTELVELLENAYVPYKIKHLDINMFGTMNMDNNHDDIDITVKKLAKISQGIAKSMPEIKQLTLSDCSSIRNIQILYSQIAELYAGQLQELDCSGHIIVSKQCVFTQLQHAKLLITDQCNITIPKQCAEKLKTLKITRINEQDSTNMFTVFDCNTDIELPNLQKLEFNCYHNISANEAASITGSTSLKLILPKLTTLVVHDFIPNYNLHVLNQMLLPAYIDSISIGAHSSIYEAIRHWKLPAANKVSLSTHHLEDNPRIVYNMNQIFNRFSNCKRMTMDINGLLPTINANDITSTNLTCLIIKIHINISTLIQFLEKLPNLTNLVVLEVDLSNIPVTINIPEISCHEQQLMVSLSTSLNEITFCYILSDYSDELKITVLLYLLLKLPNLNTCHAFRIPKNTLLTQLEQYKLFYPHISNIKFNPET